MKRSHVFLAAMIAVLGLALSGCGGGPTSPSEANPRVTLHGTALASPTASAETRDVQSLAAPGSRVTVTVQESPSLSTTISSNGTFELDGLPAGSFTLVFTSAGTALGTVSVNSVPSSAQVDLVVQITTTSVVVVRVHINGTDQTGDQKTCLINGGVVGQGIELEGSIGSFTGLTFQMDVNGNRASDLVTVDAAGASFTCAGIKGTCDATLIQTGQKVHVGGTLTSCTLTLAQVRATQVKFQH
jgi:hypothetical protein